MAVQEERLAAQGHRSNIVSPSMLDSGLRSYLWSNKNGIQTKSSKNKEKAKIKAKIR